MLESNAALDLPPDTKRTYDVLIVGAGPVGLTTALMLGRRNWRVAVVERWPSPYPRPRAVHFDGEVARVFAAAGIGPALADVTEFAGIYDWRNAAGDTLIHFDWSHGSPYGWPAANMFNQPLLERALEDAVNAQATVEVFRGYQAVELFEREDTVRLVAQGPAGQQTFAAAYIVGCDGANSFVRSRMATTMKDLGYFYDWLIVDIIPHEQRVWEPQNLQICDPRRPTTLVSGGPGRRRWEFMRMPGETIDELNNEDAAWRFLAPWNITRENATLERHAVYTFAAAWAERWREGRLLIAGDAAHLMPPFAGQGMCSGIRDASNLTWKLDLVLRGLAADRILESYGLERGAHVQHAIGMSVELGKVICVTDRHAAAERDAFMLSKGGDPSQILPPLPPPMLTDGLLYRSADGTPAAGSGLLSPQPRVTYCGRTGLLDDVVGTGPFLLALDGPGDILSERQLDFLRRIGAHVLHVVRAGTQAPPRAAIDVDGSIIGDFAQHGLRAVLVRPDNYIFGVVGDSSEVAKLVDDFARQLGYYSTHPNEALHAGGVAK